MLGSGQTVYMYIQHMHVCGCNCVNDWLLHAESAGWASATQPLSPLLFSIPSFLPLALSSFSVYLSPRVTLSSLLQHSIVILSSLARPLCIYIVGSCIFIVLTDKMHANANTCLKPHTLINTNMHMSAMHNS